MGGRGARSPNSPGVESGVQASQIPEFMPQPAPDAALRMAEELTPAALESSRDPGEERHYQSIAASSLPAPAGSYPFLANIPNRWVLLASTDERPVYDPADTFGQAEPTLRWAKDGKVIDLFVEGMSSEQYLAAAGLELSMDKGGLVLSKRLSRIMRPHSASGIFTRDVDIHLQYLDELGPVSPQELKVWDGAMVISRALLKRMLLSDDLSPARHAQVERELAHVGRVEVTIMSGDGQDKGHAIVADNLPVDVLMPRDTKQEVRLTAPDRVFVGISPVHGHDDMRLDIQSLINLHPFFEEDQLDAWLKQEGELFLQGVETGEVAAAMARIDLYTTPEDLQSWHLREYFASGGDPMGFASHVGGLVNQHLNRLEHAQLERLRLPIPGGRYYVMPIGVGAAAGVDLEIPRGQIHLDRQRGTAWVNDQDWVQLEGAQHGLPQGGTESDVGFRATKGLAELWGGADNDDALWLHPFADHDGRHKVLAWRSPNQVGEYALLEPTAGSHVFEWETVPKGPDEPEVWPPQRGTDSGVQFRATVWPAGDSRKLPARKDAYSPRYLNLIDPATRGGLGEGQPYSVQAMGAAIERTRANAGALGMTCDSLMIHKAVFGKLPEQPPAPLEQIIDADVKTGEDLTKVKDWNYGYRRQLRKSGAAVPAILHGRAGGGEKGQPLPATSDHWLDRVVGNIKAHIETVKTRRDALEKRTMPPRELFDAVIAERSLEQGRQFNGLYRAVLKRSGPEQARLKAEEYLAHYQPEQQRGILRGAMADAYLGETPSSDAAVWQMGQKTEHGRVAGIGHLAVEALREIGALDQISPDQEGVLQRYPQAHIDVSPYQTVQINGVWINQLNTDRQAGDAPVKSGREVRSAAARRNYKQQVANTNWQDMILHIRAEETGGEVRKVAYDEAGNPVGTLSKNSDGRVRAERIRLKLAAASDGNLLAAFEEVG